MHAYVYVHVYVYVYAYVYIYVYVFLTKEKSNLEEDYYASKRWPSWIAVVSTSTCLHDWHA